MREDMFQVIVERPRWAHGARYERARYEHEFQRDLDLAPAREGMSASARYATKQLNENLAPLARFLRSRVGRPWDEVYSEICASLSVRSAVQQHVRDHLRDFVRTRVWRQDGELWTEHRFGGPGPLVGRGYRGDFYVCPETRQLRAIPRKARPHHSQPVDPDLRPLSEWEQLRRIDGQWYRIELAQLPADLRQARDVVLGLLLSQVTPWALQAQYGRRDRYAHRKLQLSRRERLRHLGS
jgi:hypothetical protein